MKNAHASAKAKANSDSKDEIKLACELAFV